MTVVLLLLLKLMLQAELMRCQLLLVLLLKLLLERGWSLSRLVLRHRWDFFLSFGRRWKFLEMDDGFVDGFFLAADVVLVLCGRNRHRVWQ